MAKNKQVKSETDVTSQKIESKKVTVLQSKNCKEDDCKPDMSCCSTKVLKPKNEEYEEVGFSLVELYKIFIFFYFLIFIPSVALWEETTTPGASVNMWLRKNVYHANPMEEFVKENKVHFDSDIMECDYRKMSPKEFYNQNIATHTPCLFKDYAKTQKAYKLWNNETYLREQAGDEIIYAEKQTTNRFAYFTEGAKRVYLPFSEFLDAFKVENRTYHYYYSFAEPPGKLNEDLELPEIMNAILDITKVTYWHGFGTLTRPHTDAMENMMCVYEGYKNFSIASMEQRPYIYSGTEGYPDNYSPMEFVKPDYEKYPLSKHAIIKTIHIKAGDCCYIPAYYWHQVASSPSVSIGVATFFRTYSSVVDMFNIGI